jgi:hypothetical protein
MTKVMDADEFLTYVKLIPSTTRKLEWMGENATTQETWEVYEKGILEAYHKSLLIPVDHPSLKQLLENQK